MTPHRKTQCELLTLLIGACVASLSACSGRALVLDGAPPGAVSTADAGTMEALPLPDEIEAFWVDDARLYFETQSFELRSCLHEDCEHTAITYGGSSGLLAGLGDHDIFWPASTTVFVCPKAGCGGASIPVVRDPERLASAADGDYFYWSSAFDIYRCPSSGCGDIPEVVAHGESSPDLQFAGSRVYWWRGIGNADGGSSSLLFEIRSAPKDGSEPATTVQTISASSADFAVDAEHLYWIDGSAHVQSCPLERCSSQPPAALATSDDPKDGLRVDASGLYWREPGSSGVVIKFCSLNGCGSEPLALTDYSVGSWSSVSVGGNGRRPRAFALDSTYLYWQHLKANNGLLDTKSIRRMRKPTP